MNRNANIMAAATTHQRTMTYSYLKFLLDPAGVLGAAGTVLIGIFSFMTDMPAEYPGIAGALLLLTSVYQKVMQTKINNQRAKIEAHIAAERTRILALYESGEMDQEKADFLLGHLDIDEATKKN